MIQQDLRLEDGQGFLTIRVSHSVWSQAGGGLRSPDSEVFLAFNEADSFDCTKYPRLVLIVPGGIKKMVIVRPASSVVFSLYFHKWLLKDSCVSATSASWSIHLCSVENLYLSVHSLHLRKLPFYW